MTDVQKTIFQFDAGDSVQQIKRVDRGVEGLGNRLKRFKKEANAADKAGKAAGGAFREMGGPLFGLQRELLQAEARTSGLKDALNTSRSSVSNLATFMLQLAGVAGPVGVAFAATATAGLFLSKILKGASDNSKELEANLAAGAIVAQRAFEGQGTALAANVRDNISVIDTALDEQEGRFDVAAGNIRASLADQFSGLTGQIEGAVADAKSGISLLTSTIKDAQNRIGQLRAEAVTATGNLQGFEFEVSTRGLGDIQKAFKNIERSQDLIRQSGQAAADGDFDRARQLQAQAEASAKVADNIGQQAGNIATAVQGEEAVRNALEQRVKLIGQEKAAQEQVLAAAEKRRAAEEANLKVLAQSAKELTKAVQAFTSGNIDTEQFTKVVAEVGPKFQEALNTGATGLDLLTPLNPQFGEISEKLRAAAESGLARGLIINAESVQSQINAAIDAIDPSLRINAEVIGVESDLAFFENLRKRVGEIEKAIGQTRKQQEGLQPDAQKFQDAVAQTKKAFDDANKSAGDLGDSVAEIADARRFIGVIIDADAETKRIDKIKEKLTELAPEAAGALQALDVKRVNEIVIEVDSLKKKLAETTLGGDSEGLGKELGQLQKVLQDTNNLSEKAFQFRAAGERVRELQTNLGNVRQSLEGTAEVDLTGVSDALGSSATSAKNLSAALNSSAKVDIATPAANAKGSIDAATISAKALTDQLSAAALAAQSINVGAGSAPGPPTTAAFGKRLLFRQDGGPVTRGQDNILTALRAGESVLNVQASKRFAGAIDAANGGGNIVFREQGGSVTNTFGDINVIQQPGQDGLGAARQIMGHINTLTSRKTDNLRRKR